MSRNWSLSYKVSIPMVVILSVLCATAGWAAYVNYSDQLRSELRRGMQAEVTERAQQAQAFFERQQEKVFSFQTIPVVTRFTASRLSP